ncbi:MAG: hypothetical protein K8S16_14130 [Bacteroidales bacterium]|nr:hypothetical protein [Bacteroidales bacterium]
MKKIYLSMVMVTIAVAVLAQAPQAFKYQAVVRDNAGDIIAGQVVSIRVSIIQDSINGTIIFTEIHISTTNQFGLITLEIGTGTVEAGVFGNINWGTTSHFLKTELDETGGTNYQFMGTSQLLSVPYSLNSGSLTLTSPNGANYIVTVDDNGNLITNCFPMPSVANAGPYQDSICIPAILAANNPQYGNGVWNVVNGTGGSFADTTNPASEFTGMPGNAYTLHWTISNACGYTEDDVNISFLASPTAADAGPDQLNALTPTTLAANTPGNGTGLWTIISGTGGNISNPSDPASSFSGIPDSSYTLRWIISTLCDSTYDDVNISFFGNVPQPCPGIPTITYEGQIYNTVLIGDQCWLKENLNVGTKINGVDTAFNNGIIEKYCYNDLESYCDTLGGLYLWHEAMQYITVQGGQGICPVGWHIPTDDEWKILEGTVDSQYPVGDPEWDVTGMRGFDAGLNLKSTTGWMYDDNGTDLYGFTGLPSGKLNGHAFYNLGGACDFWSSTEYNAYAKLNRNLQYSNNGTARYNSWFTNGFSVRCLQD